MGWGGKCVRNQRRTHYLTGTRWLVVRDSEGLQGAELGIICGLKVTGRNLARAPEEDRELQ